MAANEPGAAVEMRDAFGQTLVELGRKYPRMLTLDADLHTSSKATMFKKAFPERFIQVGIAEQNLFGISAGLALSGFMPFPSTFAAFLTRAADFIRMLAISNLGVKLAGSHAGVSIGEDGPSQMALEDLGLFRSQLALFRITQLNLGTRLHLHACRFGGNTPVLR